MFICQSLHPISCGVCGDVYFTAGKIISPHDLEKMSA